MYVPLLLLYQYFMNASAHLLCAINQCSARQHTRIECGFASLFAFVVSRIVAPDPKAISPNNQKVSIWTQTCALDRDEIAGHDRYLNEPSFYP